MRTWLARFVPSTGTVVGLLLTAVVLAIFGSDPVLLQRFELELSNWRFLLVDSIRGPKQPGPEVVIAAIDEKSIDAIGRWPWPYTTHAQLINKLLSYGAAAIGYDVVFSESDKASLEGLQGYENALATADFGDVPKIQQNLLANHIDKANHDQIFATALQSSDRVILGYFFHWDASEVKHLTPEKKKEFRERIRGSEQVDVTPFEVNLQSLPLREVQAVESSIGPLSDAVCDTRRGGERVCRSGFYNAFPDPDGTIRRYPLIARISEPQSRDGRGMSKQERIQEARKARYPVYPPLGLRVLERYLQGIARVKTKTQVAEARDIVHSILLIDRDDKKYEIPTGPEGHMLLNYLGSSEFDASERQQGHVPPGRRFRFPRYSIVDIIDEGRQDLAPPEAFAGKIVLIGATATALADRRVTPVDAHFPGVEMHATIIDNVLRQSFLVKPDWAVLHTIGSILLIGVFLTLLLPHLNAVWSGVSGLLLLLGSAALNYFLFVNYGWWLNILYPLLGTVVVFLGAMLFHYVIEEANTRYLRKTFGNYVSPDLIAQMAETRTEPKLGGDSGIRTAYFTDIASFSSFSEILSASELVELLNEYLTVMTDLLEDEGGTLDKFEGDAIVAFFGAPLPMEDHAARALRTALRMQQELGQLRQKWAGEGDNWPELVHQMRMRIGINAGDIVIGNMGSLKRFNYTMMGDVVNTAARLEASAKQYGIYIQCPIETLQLAGLDDFEWREIDKVLVVGKSEPVETVEIMAYKGQLPEDQALMRDIYRQGLKLYRQQKWDEAKAEFIKSEKLEDIFPGRPTNPSRAYIERCKLYQADPPGKDWDGVWRLTSK